MNQAPNDWQDMARDWQQQPSPTIDVEALRHEVERRGRAIRHVLWLEIGATLLVLAACLYIAFAPGSDPAETWLFGLLAVSLVVYQALMVWQRRCDGAGGENDALSLVDLEIRRATTVLRYWRWGMWTALGMWLVLYGYFLAGVHYDWAGIRLTGLAGGLGINVVVFPLMGLYGWWRCRQARARLARFERLRGQLAP